MTRYRRYLVPGGTYFFTLVTYRRRRLFSTAAARRCLHDAIARIQQRWPFEIVAIVLLPDHLHTVWTLPLGDCDYSTRLSRIKELFTRTYLASGGKELQQTESRKHQRYRGIWQKRFWEHTVEDEDDLKGCVDYTHYNPKKHGLVDNVGDWPYSSFHRWVKRGEYSKNWGDRDPTPEYETPEWYS